MIQANLRSRLTAADWKLVLDVLSDGHPARRAALEARASAEGPDRLLDAEHLDQRLRALPGVHQPSAVLFVYVSVRHRLLELGCRDRRLADYVGALVLEFGLRDRAYRPARHDDATYQYLADIMAALDGESPRRAFLLRVHLGNFSLWLCGMFPEWIATRRARRGGPGLDYYEAVGARGFRMASGHRLAREFAMDDVYALAAETFPRLRVALNRLADAHLFPGRHGPDRVLRQVADHMRFTSPEA